MTDPKLERIIATSAYRIKRRYYQWVDAADVRQEMWAWVLKQPKKRIEEMPEGSLGFRLRDVGDAYARREKAAKSGYEPDDEVFYGLRMMRDLLDIIVSDEPMWKAPVDDRQKAIARSAGASPPMDYETVIADLRGAYSGLDDASKKVLQAHVADEWTDPTEVTKILRRMQRSLGGRRPRRD